MEFASGNLLEISQLALKARVISSVKTAPQNRYAVLVTSERLVNQQHESGRAHLQAFRRIRLAPARLHCPRRIECSARWHRPSVPAQHAERHVSTVPSGQPRIFAKMRLN